MEKIRLAMKDDVEVTSKKSLRENWDLERIVSYYRDGSLHRFLTERWCKGEAAKVEQLESDLEYSKVNGSIKKLVLTNNNIKKYN